MNKYVMRRVKNTDIHSINMSCNHCCIKVTLLQLPNTAGLYTVGL